MKINYPKYQNQHRNQSNSLLSRVGNSSVQTNYNYDIFQPQRPSRHNIRYQTSVKQEDEANKSIHRQINFGNRSGLEDAEILISSLVPSNMNHHNNRILNHMKRQNDILFEIQHNQINRREKSISTQDSPFFQNNLSYNQRDRSHQNETQHSMPQFNHSKANPPKVNPPKANPPAFIMPPFFQQNPQQLQQSSFVNEQISNNEKQQLLRLLVNVSDENTILKSELLEMKRSMTKIPIQEQIYYSQQSNIQQFPTPQVESVHNSQKLKTSDVLQRKSEQKILTQNPVILQKQQEIILQKSQIILKQQDVLQDILPQKSQNIEKQQVVLTQKSQIVEQKQIVEKQYIPELKIEKIVDAPQKIIMRRYSQDLIDKNEQKILPDLKRLQNQLYQSESVGNLILKNVLFIAKIKRSQKTQKKEFKNEFSNVEDYIFEELSEWCMKCSENVIQKLTTEDISCSVVQIDANVAVSGEQAKNNLVNLQEIIQELVTVLVDNIGTIPSFSLFIIGLLSSNYNTTPPAYFFKFEINRLNFSETGGISDSNSQKGQMLVLLLIFVRVYFVSLAKLFTKPVTATKVENIRTNNFKLNLIHIISTMNIILLDHLKESVVLQQNNQALLSAADKPTERPDRFIRLKNFPQSEANKQMICKLKDKSFEEPLIYPLLARNRLQIVFKEEKFIVDIKSIFQSFGESVYKLSAEHYTNEKMIIKDIKGIKAMIIERQPKLVIYRQDQQKQLNDMTNNINNQQEKIKLKQDSD